MAKFSGIQISSLDEKGRTSLPLKMREVFLSEYGEDKLVITKSSPVTTDKGEICRGLSLFPLSEFKEFEDRLDRQSGLTASQIKSVRNLLIAPAETVAMDRQGRILLPPALRAYAFLGKEVVFVGGQNNKIDLWQPTIWEQVCSQAERDFPADSPLLADLGI